MAYWNKKEMRRKYGLRAEECCETVSDGVWEKPLGVREILTYVICLDCM